MALITPRAPLLPAPLGRALVFALPLWGMPLVIWLLHTLGVLDGSAAVPVVVLCAFALPVPALRMMQRSLRDRTGVCIAAMLAYWIAAWMVMALSGFVTATFIGLSSWG